MRAVGVLLGIVILAPGCGMVIMPQQPEAKTSREVETGPKLPREFTNTLGMRFVLIPPGEFTMGSPETEARRNFDEGPQHPVRITKPFYIGVTEVTQAQWKAVMDENPSQFKGDNLPVEHISWKDAQEFIKKLSEKEGKAYRFPTEAEWEYACRAGTKTPFYTGETISPGQANYDGSYTYGDGTKGVFRQKTTPAGSFQSNPWGLYDMSGNVPEWCQDWYDAWYYEKSSTDNPPGGPQMSDWSARILRGGTWDDPPWVCRSAARHRDYPGYGDDFYGLRVALTAAVQNSPPPQNSSGTDASTAARDAALAQGSIQSMYGKVDLSFAAWLHAQVSANIRDTAGVVTRDTGSYFEFSFYIKATPNAPDIKDKAFAMVKLDMEDEDDLIEQLYFQLNDLGGSPVSISFGEKQVRFGQWAAIAYNSGLAYGWPAVSGLRFPGWWTDVVQFETKVKAHSTTDFYVSTLLNPDALPGDDTGFFQSYSMQVDTKPVKGLHARLSYLNFHDEAKILPGESRDAKAFSVGATYSKKPWRVFAEFVGTRDWNYTEGYDLSLYEVGAFYDITDKLGFGILYDKARAKGQGAGGADARLTNVMAGFKYKIGQGMEAFIEYTFQKEASADQTLDRVEAGMCWWF